MLDWMNEKLIITWPERLNLVQNNDRPLPKPDLQVGTGGSDFGMESSHPICTGFCRPEK